MPPALAVVSPPGSLARDEAVTSTVARLLESMRFDHTQGTLEILGARFFYFRASLVINIVKELEGTLGARAWETVERAAEATGYEACQSWDRRDRLPVAKGVEALRPIWSLLALGVISVQVAEDEGRAIIRTPNSPWPEAYGRSDHPVCHVFTGYAKGVLRGLGHRVVRCQEESCRAMGDDVCKFELLYEPAQRGPHAR